MNNNARKYNRYNEVDERILALFAENKEKAFRLLYDTYYLPLCLYSVQFTGSAETSEDIVQNLFVSFWDKNSHTTISSNLHAWLFNAVRFSSLTKVQRERYFSLDEMEEESYSPIDDFYDEEDEYFDDEEFDEKPARRSLFGKKNTKEESFDDFDMEEEKKFQPASSSKVTPMRHPASRKGGNMEVCVVKPSSVDDSREITETLLSGRTVILNLEGMDLELAQRIIDFISGATFAINGNLQKISNYIFLVTPTNVDISGDLQDLLGGSMETPSVKGRY